MCSGTVSEFSILMTVYNIMKFFFSEENHGTALDEK